MALTVQIKKRLEGFRLEVDFTARDGEPLALLGASGCGKSMTLQCVAGIRRPDWGRIELDGEVLFDSGRHIDLPPQRRRVGYLFQQYALFPNMTVGQNIAVCLGRAEESRRRERTAELVRMLRLEGLEGRRPRQLSGGQQQRAALARILASEPRAILLDEPFSALDSHLKWQLEADLADVLARFPGPVVWVSHDRGEVCRNCRQVCVLDSGRSAPASTVRELMECPRTVSAARLSGCENYVPIRPGPEPDLVSVPDWHLTLRCAGPWREGAAVLGIRACHVRPAAAGEVNAFPCETVRVTEDVSAVLADLRIPGSEGPLLRMELDREAWAALPDRGRLWVSVPPERLLLLAP